MKGLMIHDPEHGYTFEVGICKKHMDLAKRYDDGSWGCWWECTVESDGEHDDSDFIPMAQFMEDTAQ